MSEPILAWHFVNKALRDGRPIPLDGEWLHHTDECRMCKTGLHASRRIIDALQYAPGSTICRVAIANIAEEQADKLVARSRLIMWRLESSDELLRSFARKSALSVIHLWDAPDIVRRYLETGDKSIEAAAEDAAWAASGAVAWAAAWAASRDAAWSAARAAARDAAWAAAWAASGAVAWTAARDAARAASEAAAWAVARDVTIEKFNTQLEAMVIEARGNPDDQALLKMVPACPHRPTEG